MEPITIFGWTAAICTTISFIPQAIKTIKTKHTKDLSLGMYALMFIGVIMWLVYGILLKELPMITANLISLILAGTVLGMKIKHG